MAGVAVCADVSTSTMSEDAAKVDVKLSFRHAFRPKKLLTLHAQIKTGRSFRQGASTRSAIRLGIDNETVHALRGSGEPGLILWVPPQPLDRIYWHSTDPRRPVKPKVWIDRGQYIRPSLRYDLTRLIEYGGWNNRSPRQTVAACPDNQLMSRAREAYAALKAAAWTHPLVGNLGVTQFAWRHVTRDSRSTSDRRLRLRIAPYLRHIIGRHPDRYVCNPSSLEIFGTETRETRYVLCWYRNALSIDGESHSLLLRIREQIKYPTNWQSRSLGVRDIRQSATLASWWPKKDK